MSPSWFATIMAVGAALGTVVSVALGYISDKVPDRRVLVLIAASAGMAGHGLIYAFPTQLGFSIATALIMPFGLACFSQCFAFARLHYSHKASAERADFIVTALRTVFTVAWIIVPPVAGWVAERYSIFNIYLASSLSYAAIALIFTVLMTDDGTKVLQASSNSGNASSLPGVSLPLSIVCGLIGLVAMTMALRILTYTAPLFIVNDLGGSTTDVGLYAAITAATEAPFMLLWGYLTMRLSKEALLTAAGLVTALFMALSGLSQSVEAFFWLLALNGLGTAALMSINISYIQEAIRGRVGLSTSLMDVVAIAANLLGATAFGVLTSGGNYRFALLTGAAVAVLGAAFMAGGNLGRLGTWKPATRSS